MQVYRSILEIDHKRDAVVQCVKLLGQKDFDNVVKEDDRLFSHTNSRGKKRYMLPCLHYKEYDVEQKKDLMQNFINALVTMFFIGANRKEEFIMAIDFSKVTFNENDADELPIQYFFNLEISSEELHTIIEKKDYEEMSSDNEDFISASDLSAELCLSSFDYCSNDCKLEMVITDSYASQIWIVIESMASKDTVDKLMNLVPKLEL